MGLTLMTLRYTYILSHHAMQNSAHYSNVSFFQSAANEDYLETSVPVTFTSNTIDSVLCVSIPIINDLLCEGNEQFQVQFTEDDENLVLVNDEPRTLTITDDDSKYNRKHYKTSSIRVYTLGHLNT